MTGYKLPCSSKTCLPQATFSRGVFTPQRRHSDPASGRQFLENENWPTACIAVNRMYYVYSTYFIGRKESFKRKRGFSLDLQVDGKKLLLNLDERRIKEQKHVALKVTTDLSQKKKFPNLTIATIKSLFLRFHILVSQTHRSGQCFVYSHAW